MIYKTENELLMGSLNGVRLSHSAMDDNYELLWAALSWTDFLQTDVGQHGCYIWKSRCHAISSNSYASPMMSNLVFLFAYFAYVLPNVVTQDTNEREYVFQQLLSNILKCWNIIKTKTELWCTTNLLFTLDTYKYCGLIEIFIETLY